MRRGGPIRVGSCGQFLDDPAGDARGEEGVAAGDDPDGVEDVLGWGVLEQEPAGAGPDGGVHVVVDVEGRQHHHPHTGQVRVGSDPPGGFDAVEHRHADVHQHHIGPLPTGQLDRLLAVGGLTDQLEVGGVVDHASQPGADQRLIIDDTDPHGHVDAPNGRRAATWKPPIGPGPTSRSPWYMATRSRMPTRPCPVAAGVRAASHRPAGPSSSTSTVTASSL